MKQIKYIINNLANPKAWKLLVYFLKSIKWTIIFAYLVFFRVFDHMTWFCYIQIPSTLTKRPVNFGIKFYFL